jgi:hypothetical protein
MSLTYATVAEADTDRAQQLRLLAALGAWDRALRRDELAAWAIMGTRGRIYTDGRGWVLYATGRSVRHWSALRAKLAAFATITLDGEDEGVARLHGLPGPGQAAVIREALGIRKRAEISAGHRERLRAIGFGSRPHREAVSAARIGEDKAA